MIGISVASEIEWGAVLEKFGIDAKECEKFPLGTFFKKNLFDEEVIIYNCGIRKTNCSAATQYMIDKFDLKKIVVIGTCAGIDTNFKTFDVFFPNKLVQYDCSVKETEPLIKDDYTVELDLSQYEGLNTGTLGTADKAVVMWKDYLELKDNNITIADMEATAISYICKINGIECVVVKGISDFPTDEKESSNKESFDEQFNVFAKNTPIVMNNIIDNYLEFAIKNHFNYKE